MDETIPCRVKFFQNLLCQIHFLRIGLIKNTLILSKFFFDQSMGKSLTFRGAVFEAQDILKHHRCKDPICDTHLWKVKHELDLARMKIRQLYKELEAHGIKPSRRYLNFSFQSFQVVFPEKKNSHLSKLLFLLLKIFF